MIDLTQFFIDYRERYAGKRKEYATFGLQWTPLAASVVQQQSDLTTGIDAEFVVTNFYGSQTNVPNTAFIATPLILMLQYTTMSRNITNIKVEWTSMVGTTANPRVYLPYPIVIPRASQFSGLMDNPQAVASNVWLTVHGFKVFGV